MASKENDTTTTAIRNIEDVDASSPQPEASTDTGSKSASQEAKPQPAVKEKTPEEGSIGTKRQRTLVDMFGAPKTTKKAKVAESSAATTSSSSPPLKSSGSGQPSEDTLGIQRLNSIPFSLSAFKESLSEDEKNLLRLECETIGLSWLKLLKDEIRKPYFLKLKKFLWDEGVHGPDDSPPNLKIYPPPRNIYAWTSTPLGKVKVVILGQDPYHGPRQANGFCFSVPDGVKVPPSLRNIYTEIKNEYSEFVPPKHGNLSTWATNGVLLLNASLTVHDGQAGSHQGKGWETFTEKVVDIVDRYGGSNIPLRGSNEKSGYGRGVVFLAWGAWAEKRCAKLDKKKHLILKSPHPSPLSAHRGFLGNGHFKKANDWLRNKYGDEGVVDWTNLSGTSSGGSGADAPASAPPAA